jgi:cupin superfamily acireductone dioxygenase involved in methionine salvage
MATRIFIAHSAAKRQHHMSWEEEAHACFEERGFVINFLVTYSSAHHGARKEAVAIFAERHCARRDDWRDGQQKQ